MQTGKAATVTSDTIARMTRAYCSGTVAALLLALVSTASAQTPNRDSRGYIVFLGGQAIGREDVTTTRSAEGVTIAGRSRLGTPVDVSTSRAEMRYRTDWTPDSLEIEALVGGKTVTLKTSFSGATATSEMFQDGRRTTATDAVSAQTVVIPSLFFGTYEALAQRLNGLDVGATLPAYAAPDAEVSIRVRSVRPDRVQTGRTVLELRQYELGVTNPTGQLIMQLAADGEGHLVRLTIPAQGLDMVREDVASASSRSLTHAVPGDEPVSIPAYGFNLAGTLTVPKAAASGKRPAVLILGDSSAGDRDGVSGGVAVVSQLAGALAESGYVVLRYDRRGYGQSGGRAETVTLSDAAEDARTAVKYLAGRKGVDARRIALIGHGDASWVALIAASRDERIRAVVTLGSAGTTGAELVLAQQAAALTRLKVPEADQQGRIALQKQIHAAVLSGQGWDGVPRELRRAADTPWFQSLLQFDPAKVIKDVDQPLLIVHGELDGQVPPAHAETLLALAKKRGPKRLAEVAVVPGVNRALAIDQSSTVAAGATAPIAAWLTRTLSAR